jgi:hypothetical protein
MQETRDTRPGGRTSVDEADRAVDGRLSVRFEARAHIRPGRLPLERGPEIPMGAHSTEVVARRGHARVKRGTQRVRERRGRRDGWCGACA